MALDFMTAREAACHNRIEVEVVQDGLCHGWLGWFRTRVGDKWLSTSPQGEQTHWRQVFMPLNEPIPVKQGDALSFELNRPEFGEWTWTVGYGDKHQRQSTFLSEPIATAVLQMKSDGYKPWLSQKGQAAQDVLQYMNGNESTAEIVDHIVTEHGELFPDLKLADRFVKALVKQYDAKSGKSR